MAPRGGYRVWSDSVQPWGTFAQRLLRRADLAAKCMRKVACCVAALKPWLIRELRDRLWPFFGRGWCPLCSRRLGGTYPFVEVDGGLYESLGTPEGFASPYGPPPFLRPLW